MDSSPSTGSGGVRKKPRVSIACTNCRTQHLRCDAQMPKCSRCTFLEKQCVYKDLRRTKKAACRSSVLDEVAEAIPLTSTITLEPLTTFPLTPGPVALQQSTPNAMLLQPLSQTETLTSTPSRLLDSFYSWFFPAHPFILPRSTFESYCQKDPGAIASLKSAMELIGSHYEHRVLDKSSRLALEQCLSKRLAPSVFQVQALMLYALVLEWSGDCPDAERILSKSKSMALDMDLHRRVFADKHGRGDSVLQESMRRTWYELYILDSLFAGIRHLPTFELHSVDFDVDLPCEESDYISLTIPAPRSLAEYDSREFEYGETTFSSYTYLIDGARILGTCLAAGDIAGKHPLDLVKNAEANIMSWHLHLPASKRDPVQQNNFVDEVLFRGHLMIQTVATHLHRPRSVLEYSTMELLCSRYAPPLPAEVLSREERQSDRHTSKAIQAAKAFVDLLSVPAPPISHSPFVMCMGSLAMATHLSACEYMLKGHEYAHAKDRVRVFLGILKAFEGIWPQATKWSSEVKFMAKAVFEVRDSQGLPSRSSQSVGNISMDILDKDRVEDLDVYFDTTATESTESYPPI